MRRVWPVLALLVLAGCSQAPADDGAATAQTAATHGDLRGSVVDPGVRPLANATVLLTGSLTRSANTSSDGGFLFTKLPVGTYFVKVRKVGFLDVQTTVQLNATEAVARITLEPDLSYRVPVVVPYKHRGLVQCGVVVSAPPLLGYAAVAACKEANRASGTQITSDSSQVVHVLADGAPTFVQSELQWTSDQALGNQLLMYNDALERGGTAFVELGSKAGPNPVIVTLTEGRTGKLGKGSDLQVRIFPWYESPAPAGATVEQEFEVVSHVFYGFAPKDGWMFSVDGVPIPPPQ